MMARRILLCLLTALFVATVAQAATVVPVSLKMLIEIQTNRTIPSPWVIRFSTPNGQTEKERQSFLDAAMVVDRSVAQFGHFIVDTYDKARTIEAMGVRTLPITRFMQFQAARPTGPRATLSGRVLFVNSDLPASAASEEIVKSIYGHTPMRYHHPLTNQPINSVTYALTVNDLADRAKLTLPAASPADTAQHTMSVLGGGANAKAVLFYFHLMKKNNVATHAEINSLASRLGPRLTVFATEDADIARRFGLTQPFSAAAFYLKDVAVDLTVDPSRKTIDGKQIVPTFPEKIYTITTADELGNAGDCASFAEGHALPASEYEKHLDNELQRWHKDITQYYNKSPLIKISHSSQFRREVMANKAMISIVFMLREADRHFNRYHRTAIEFATFVRDTYRVAPGIYPKLHPQLFLQTFWIDGEMQDKASRFLNTKTVPSVAFLMHTKTGAVAVKYFSYSEEDKKRRKKKGQDTEWPDVQDLMAFVVSEQLLMGAPGMSQFTDEDVNFNDDLPNADGPANANAVDHNHRYLCVDRKHYHIGGEEKAGTFIADLQDGKITVDADHYAKEGDENAGEKKKKAKKLSAKEEARRQKLQEDIERKKKEREERTKAKEEEDRKRREEEAKQTKKEITKKARASKKKKTKSANPEDAKPQSIEGESVTAPPLAPGRVKKDWNVWKKDWEADSRRMVDKFVKNAKGGIRVGKGLNLPDWRKK